MENFYLKPLTPSLHGLRRLAAMVLLLLSAVTAGPAAAGEQDSGKQQPTIQAKGRVVDTNGIAIAGAAVTVKGGSAGGTISDAQGAFTLRVRKGDVLHVSFLGFQAREIAVTDASPLTIRLAEETHQVEDVVVVGYGVQKKESVLGAISQVSNEQLVNSGTTNITNAIAGKLSGVTTIQTGGQPATTTPTSSSAAYRAGTVPRRWCSLTAWSAVSRTSTPTRSPRCRCSKTLRRRPCSAPKAPTASSS